MILCLVALTFQIGRFIDSMALMQVTCMVMQLMFQSRRDTSALALVLTTSRAIQRRRHTKRLIQQESGIAALVVYCWPALKLVVVWCFVRHATRDMCDCLCKVVGPEAAIPIDLEVKQVQAGVLWTMFTAVKDTLSQVTQSGLVKKVLDDIPKAVEASNKIAEALQRHPPPAPGNELAWIEWGKQLTSTKSFDFTKENDYHKPLDAEMKWLYTLLFDQGVQASLKARLSKMSTEWMAILYLYVTQDPCNFCVQMLLLHHPKLKAIYAPSDKQTLKVHVLAQAEYRKSSSTGYGQLSSAERQKVDIIPYWHTAGASLPAVL